MPATSRFRNWVLGTVRREIPASSLEGVRQAGAAAYSLAEEAEGIRSDPAWSPWLVEPDTQLFLVCAWNAFALQSTGDQLLEADARDDPSTVGRVPETTYAYAWTCFVEAMVWVESARFARSNAAYRSDRPLPSPLPPWPHLEPTRVVHVKGLQSAYDALAPRAEHELQRLRAQGESARAAGLAEMSLLCEQMHTSVEFAGGLRLHAETPGQLAEARDDLVRGLGCAYRLGQLVAMPSLVERMRLVGYRAKATADVPLTAIGIGWPVVDSAGTRLGSVSRIEGEPTLGTVTGFVIATDASSADRRVRIDQVQVVQHGLVRLAAVKDELERVR